MAGVKLWLIPVYAAAAFLVAVFCIPGVGWVPRMHLDVLTGRWTRNQGTQDNPSYGPYLTPKSIGPTESDQGSDEDTQLLKILDAPQGSSLTNSTEPVWDTRMKSLSDFCTKKGTKEFLALFLRFASVSLRIPGPKEHLLPSPETHAEVRHLAIVASQAGERLDPDNAFFPVMEAGALYNVGDRKSSHAAFLASSTKGKFDDYMELEANIRSRWLVDHRGYRGNQMGAWVAASLLLPHYATVKSVARAFDLSGVPQDRIAALKVGDLLIRRATTVIGIFVGRGIIVSALRPGIDLSEGHAPKEPEARAVAKALEAKVPGTDLAKTIRDYLSVNPDSVFTLPLSSRENLLESNRSSYGAAVLLAIFLLPVMLGWAWLCTRFEPLSAASPYLAWLLVVQFAIRSSEGIAWVGLFVGLFLAVPAMFKRTRTATDLVALALAAFTYYLGLTSAPLIPLTVMFLVSLALERRVKRASWMLTAVSALAAAGLAALGWISHSTENGVSFGVFLILLFGSLGLIRARRGVAWEPIAGTCCLALACGYSFYVYGELKADRGLGNVMQSWLQEGDTVRAQIHVS